MKPIKLLALLLTLTLLAVFVLTNILATLRLAIVPFNRDRITIYK